MMSPRDKMAFRKWWWVLPIVVAASIGGALLVTNSTQPTYKATCRLFVAVAANTLPSETYQGGLFAQDRVVAYTELIKSERVAQGAINRLGLSITAKDLVSRIEAKAALKSVLIDVSVTDSDASRAADLANAVCSEFVGVATDTEAPSPVVNIKLVEIASVPDSPISPKPVQNLAVGALGGLLLGVALVLMLGRIWPAQESIPENKEPEPDPATVGISRNGHADTNGEERRHRRQGSLP
jgi:capsular polysaccharide biosynthesis protein